MKQTVLSESIEYADNKRITTQTIETTTSLADDRASLANYYGTLAALEGQLEQLRGAQVDPAHKATVVGEISRVQSEMQTIEQAIEIQNQYIRGFGDGAV